MSGSNGASIEIGQSDQELVGSKKKANIKKIAVITTICLVIIAVIAIVVVFVTQNNDDDAPPKPLPNAIELDDILNGRLVASRGNATWYSGNELLFRDDYGSIVIHDVNSEKTTEILSQANYSLIHEIVDYVFSADKKFLLLSREARKIFRHSAASLYDVVDLETMQVYPLTVNGTQDFLELAKWSPVGNGLVFVWQRNIYYKASASASEIQITKDGNNTVFNGVCDWVYEEEVFASKEALWFSPDGSKLAFVRFDDSPVHLMNLPIYGVPGQLEFQYTFGLSISYPKVGTDNPIVTLFSVDLSAIKPEQTVIVSANEVPQPLRQQDHIISAVSWQNNQSLVSVWMNRVQNKLYVQKCTGNVCALFKTIESAEGWVDLFKSPLFNADGTQMLIITSQQQGTFGGYRHLTLVDTTGGIEVPLTSGRFVVQEILKYDTASNVVFYSANTEQDSQVLHIYAVRAVAGQTAKCLTCNIKQDGVDQTYFSAEFSANDKNVVLTTEGPSVPRVDVYSYEITNNEINFKFVTELETNDELRNLLKTKATPRVQYLNIPLDSGVSAKVRLQLPPNADLSGSVKYPMLIDVYAGPDSYAGSDKWNMDWGSYLAANKSVIYAQINGRGSGLRGDKLMHSVYRKLGTFEIDDQTATATKLHQTLPYIDASRIAIWGWSYGGYAAGMALAKDDKKVYSCAASVAPVTDWTYYDSIYTERYMGLPTQTDNFVGYNNSRLSTRAESFRGKKYYLIHGTLDDNVHYQQAMALSKSLEQNDVMFKQMSYPDENHGLWGVRHHLYHSLGRFFGECFSLKQDL